MPPVIVSLINLKGGVGKTTTTIQLAECLSSEYGKRVLVIDLDPQTNATISLIDESRWVKLNEAGLTIAQMFKDKIEQTQKFDLTRAIQVGVSTLKIKTLSLLASSIDLIHIQDRMGDISSKTHNTLNPMEVLKHAIGKVVGDYDYILIDCPPNLGFITKNGIEISDYYLIPTIPDTLSTYGIPQIIESIHNYSQIRSLKIRCMGLVLTKVNANSAVHASTKSLYPAKLAAITGAKKIPPVRFFEACMPQANNYADAMDLAVEASTTFKQKWGQGRAGGKILHEHVTDLTKEFMRYAI